MGLSTTRDIGMLLHKCRNRIQLIGVELEGGWHREPPGGAIIRDGSVRIDPPIEVNKAVSRGSTYPNYKEILLKWEKERPNFIGELPSRPMKVSDMPQWMKANYPSHLNETCGLHLHMSFKGTYHYSLLMRPTFQDVVVEYIRRWAQESGLPTDHPIWGRLRGESQYCQLKYLGDAQAAIARKAYERNARVHRYTAINYSFSTHGTLECRLLPMMPTVDLAIEALDEVMAITNAFLVSEARKEEKYSCLIQADEGDSTTIFVQENV